MQKTWVDMGIGTCRSPSDTHYFVNFCFQPSDDPGEGKSGITEAFCFVFSCTLRKLSHLSVALFRCPGKKGKNRKEN